jgi:NADPH-dependent curcumin reductase CurA
MTTRNRRVLYARRPREKLTADCFALDEAPAPSPGAGQILIRNRFLSIDPYQRRQMLGVQGYPTELREGGVMIGRGVGEIVETRDADWRVGEAVLGDFGWQHYALAEGRALRRVDAQVDPLSLHLGMLGPSGETAWYGLTQLGRPEAGQTVLVSAAGGAVGSAVGQIARILGCRVLGIAGGAQKCADVVREFGFDACLDHRDPELEHRIAEAAPDGVDVYFDNVGGAVLDAVLPSLAMRARIALCGLIAHYDTTRPFAFRHIMRLLDQSVTLTGFRIGFVAPELRETARKQLAQWWREGKLQARETVSDGIESAPAALMGLLEGGNMGKRIVRLGED